MRRRETNASPKVRSAHECRLLVRRSRRHDAICEPKQGPAGAAVAYDPAVSESDPEQIARRVQAYGERVANGDLEGIADLFVRGAVSGDAHPTPVAGRAAVLELYRNTLATGGPPRRLRVSTTDLDIAIDGDTATCNSRFTVLAPGSDDTPLFAGRYADRFARIDGRWEFTHRHVHLDATNTDAVARVGINLD